MTISLFRVLCVLEFKKKKLAIMNNNMSQSLSLKSSENHTTIAFSLYAHSCFETFL